ncbi:DUF5937 family protein [Streptomyces sp. NPDC003522]
MPLRLSFGEDDLLRCRFAVSPLWETQEAVRTLNRPDRHGFHQPWLREVRHAARGLDLSPLWLLMPRHGHSPDWLSPQPLGPATLFDEEIARVRAADPRAAHHDTARSLADSPGAADSPLGRALLRDAGHTITWLAGLLEEAWRVLVEPYWPRLRALLRADVAFHSRHLAETGLGGLLPRLDGRITWRTGTLTVRAGTEHVRHLGGEGLVLMPSVFSWPDVVGGFEPPWKPMLVYPARGVGGLWAKPSAPAPRTLARLLGSGRAAVLGALDEPAGTTALARRLGLAASSVSAHLSVLRDAGLLTSHRHGHEVLYSRTPLGTALADGGDLP